MIRFFQSLTINSVTQPTLNFGLHIGGQSNAVASTNGTSPSTPYTGDINNVDIELNGSFVGLNYPNTNQGDTHGIELSFGYNYAQKFNKKLHITKAALGGSAIANDPNRVDWNPNTNELINDLIASVQLMKTIADITPNFKFIFYWNQGERDVTLGTGSQWESIFAEIIQVVDDILPIDLIIVTIVNESASVNSKTAQKMADVRNSQISYVSNEPRAEMIDMNNYILGADGVHFTSDVQIQLGIDVLNIVKNKFNL